MRVRFIGTMPATGYSGGRLLALTMAEALALTGADVDFLVDHIPEMYQEFEAFSQVKMVRVNLSDLNLSPYVDRKIDIVVIIPHQGAAPLLGEWTRHAIECRAKIILLNFETPNWFNAVSPFKRDVASWIGWDIVSEYAHLILSISGEGNKYAREYYHNCSPNCLFEYSYPGINSIMADQAPLAKERDKRIVLLTRVDAHKGFNVLEPLIHPGLSGYQVDVYLGNGQIDAQQVKNWSQKFNRVGMTISVKPAIKGVDKFAMLKRASLLYFPTRFEGFGIPPLEAAYCSLACACSDLPVLREFGQQAFVYGTPQNVEDMRRAVMTALESNKFVSQEHERISQIAKLDEYGCRLEKIFHKIL